MSDNEHTCMLNYYYCLSLLVLIRDVPTYIPGAPHLYLPPMIYLIFSVVTKLTLHNQTGTK